MMNPILPIEKLIVLVLVLVPLGGWLAWRSASVAARGLRIVLTALRALALLLLALAAFNPGHHQTRPDADAAGLGRLARVERNHVHIDRDAGRLERFLRLLAGHVESRQVHHQQVRVGPARNEAQALLDELLA